MSTSHTSRAYISNEEWLNKYHWDAGAEIEIVAAGAAGERLVGAPVAAGKTRRIREATATHEGSANTVIRILDRSGGNIIVRFDVPAQSTRTWSSQDGRKVPGGLQPVIQTSSVTGGHTIVSVAGVEY